MCNCSVCTYHQEFIKHLNYVPEEHQAFFENMMDILDTTQMDLDFYKMKYAALKAEGGSDVNPV